MFLLILIVIRRNSEKLCLFQQPMAYERIYDIKKVHAHKKFGGGVNVILSNYLDRLPLRPYQK